MNSDSPELLDAFRAAALSVTKLYKTSAAAQAKSRTDGYHDCLEDLVAFLDKEGLGASSGEGWKIRKWATDRLEGREPISQSLESEDEADKPEIASPQAHRSSSAPQPTIVRNEVQMKDPAPAPAPATQPVSPISTDDDIGVPTQDTFTFQSSIPYPPQEAHMSLANLDLSDGGQTHNRSPVTTTTTTTPRNLRGRSVRTAASRTALGRGAGQKRKVNLAEIFDLGSLGHGNGKDMFGNGGKRGRFI